MGEDEAKCILGACCDAPNTIKAIQGKQHNTILGISLSFKVKTLQLIQQMSQA